jgi:fructose/tagatose bisphosphate aldolase
MMLYSTTADLSRALRGVVAYRPEGGVTVDDAARVQETLIDDLVRNGVFNPSVEVRDACKWLVRHIAQAMDAVPASIQTLYNELGKGAVKGFTVPAVNIRGPAYDFARALIRAALEDDVGAIVFELARSEMGYTFQRPDEYALCVCAAAVKEGFRGPLFIQGDHFQFNAKKFAADPAAETKAIKDLTKEAIAAGFYNIDIDSSTLVDLSHATLKEQQRLNYEKAAEMTLFIRGLQPEGITVSVGGEIGEVGKKNTTPDEFEAYMAGYNELVRAGANGGGVPTGISKISIQTGTSHGGVPLPDGSVAKVAIDFDALHAISEIARGKFGMSGAVQHGASTLPDEVFNLFPKNGTAEIHLATGFQNLLYDHPAFPADLRARIKQWCVENCADERKAGETDEQFVYKTRKKAYGPFKRELWELPADARQAIFTDLEKKFSFLFHQLGVVHSRAVVDRHVSEVVVNTPIPAALKAAL